MNIFEFAIQMEADGQDFYQQLASKTTNNGIKKILNMLADDELKHQTMIDKIRITSCVMPETEVLENAKNVFRQMRDFGGQFDLSGDEEMMYRQAMELEQKSIGFYQDKADQMDTPEQKELFLKLAEEEKKHYFLLDSLVDFVAAPKTWLEDAEFDRLDEY
ncbi:MAG: ferritin family protein [Planctomycetes bacterium]|nr:ferritin family protein [Planctomycetota bacterium]